MIVNKMLSTMAHLPYDYHERAFKLLHALDHGIWKVKVSVIIESPNYETLTIDELFNKLKFTDIDHQTQAKIQNPSAPTMALICGGGSSSNPSLALFAFPLCCLLKRRKLSALGIRSWRLF
jgi:hypothetical protein